MNTEMQKRALAAREARLALLDLKRVVNEATQTTISVTDMKMETEKY